MSFMFVITYNINLLLVNMFLINYYLRYTLKDIFVCFSKINIAYTENHLCEVLLINNTVILLL